MGFDFVPRGEGSFSEDTRVAAALILVLLLLGLSNFFLGIQKAEWVGGGQLWWVGIDFHDEWDYWKFDFTLAETNLFPDPNMKVEHILAWRQ